MMVVEFLSNEQTEPLGRWLLDAVPRAGDTLRLMVTKHGDNTRERFTVEQSYKVINVQWVVDAFEGQIFGGEIEAVVYIEGENA